MSNSLRYRIIVNPHSSRGECAKAIPRVRELLDAAKLSYELIETEEASHAVELAHEAAAAGFDVVVAMGGDGIMNEVLNGLMVARNEGHGACAMALLPVGRGNDFAFGSGLPIDLDAACASLVANHRRRIDIGVARGGDYPEGRYFGNGVGIGFDAVVGFEAFKLTWLSGFASYAVAAFKTIMLYFKAPLLRIEFDGYTTELYLLLLSVMNGQRMGGGFYMAPDGVDDDGWFDLCIGQEHTRRQIFAIIPHFMKGTQFHRRGILGGRTKRIKVTAIKGTIPAHADGETLCTAGQSLDIELLPLAMDLVCPAVPIAKGS